MSSDGSWLGMFVCIERMTQMSSMQLPMCGKMSLTSIPDSPHFLNLNGDISSPPVFRSVFRSAPGGRWPLYFSSAGFGSNVSTWDGPPFIKRWITCFARGAK